MNSDTNSESESKQAEEAVASPSVNLLLGLLPLSACLVQIPFANILAPWIAWLCVKKENPASQPIFRSVMNMQISWTLYGFAALLVVVFALTLAVAMGLGGFPPNGGKGMEAGVIVSPIFLGVWLVILPLGIVWLVMTILFAIRVKNDVNAKPPLTIRFLK